MYEKIIESAIKAKRQSHSPFSKFKVGVALLTKEGSVYTGGNVESSSFSLTVCAERAAAVKAINDRKRVFKAIAIAASSGDFEFPCGACRQFLSEFSENMDIILVKSRKEYRIFKLQNLLPHKFKLKMKGQR
ncbi:MAG: cytidine deaminase [Ignavibacteria bacterium]|nr:cytidine deaminase [Ignavibacteria bacterium]